MNQFFDKCPYFLVQWYVHFGRMNCSNRSYRVLIAKLHLLLIFKEFLLQTTSCWLNLIRYLTSDSYLKIYSWWFSRKSLVVGVIEYYLISASCLKTNSWWLRYQPQNTSRHNLILPNLDQLYEDQRLVVAVFATYHQLLA